jgi:hypothetical protein
MAPKCSICAHPESFAINEAIVIERKSNRVIARQYRVGHDSVQRHKAHIPELLLKARENMDAYDASSILAKIRDLEEETLEQLQGAKDDEDRRYTLAAIREQRGNLELVARVAKLISDAPVVNVLQNPQWVEVRIVVLQALEAHPAARDDVVRALKGMRDA